ncbi:MAG: UDP-N-acetylmuramoyl-tripeptide--D-alanyl-D-alanine ligase [Legionellaceae bacterium]|nr:UDP-N-acetylmuramoyl-tripeptide--D-alanyl-D-alanine ligase [Legionellaceae bacterium]
MITLNDLSTWLAHPPCSEQAIHRFQINSQQIQAGDVFIALPGEHTDGHHYIAHAASQGAIAIICERPQAKLNIPQFVVPETAKALGFIARQHRKRLHCPVIALTGSNGKTSVKEMIAACLPAPFLATSGNLNNHLGVPLMVLRLNRQHRFAVFECGANHAGEIAYTAAICQPDIALINNIAPAHIEGFGSIEGVARAKGEIYSSLAANKIAIVNDDDHYAHFWDAQLLDKQVLRFSRNHPADISAHHIQYDSKACASFQLRFPDQQNWQLQLRVPGAHMVANACAAASCLWAAGIDGSAIVEGLAHFQGVPGRQTLVNGLHGACIIDDSYNANLHSVLAGIAVLRHYGGQRILVLGDMGELGSHSLSHHQEVGTAAKTAGIDHLLTIGENSHAATQAFGAGAWHFTDKKSLLSQLRALITAETTVLVKGSRSAAMETIVAPLLLQHPPVEG